MTLPVVFRRRFRNDLAAGYDWYEAQRLGLGDEFLSAVESTVTNIESYSGIFAVVHADVRRVIIQDSPSRFFKVVEPTRVVALRLLHTARDPKLWPPSRT